MSELLPALILGLSTGSTVAVAGLQQVDGETVIPLKIAAGISVFVCGLVWWLSHRLTRIEVKIEQMEDKIDRVMDEDHPHHHSRRRYHQVKD